MHILSNKFCDSCDSDSKEDISDAEQLPVPSRKGNDDHQSSIKQFSGVDVYKSGLIAYLTHFHQVLTHTNLMWLKSLLQGRVVLSASMHFSWCMHSLLQVDCNITLWTLSPSLQELGLCTLLTTRRLS